MYIAIARMWEIEEKNILHATNGERFNKLFIAFESSLVFVVPLLLEKRNEYVTMCCNRTLYFEQREKIINFS